MRKLQYFAKNLQPCSQITCNFVIFFHKKVAGFMYKVASFIYFKKKSHNFFIKSSNVFELLHMKYCNFFIKF